MSSATAAHAPMRSDRENLLGQRSVVVWLTGLSGAGKTTLAGALQNALHANGRLCAVLDGDQLRAGLNCDLGFSEQDRTENIRRIAEVSRILIDTGVIAIVAAISPTLAMREQARALVGRGDFIEVYVECPLEVCRARDVKGLYRKAEAGALQQFTGISAVYEPPDHAALVIHTQHMSVEQACHMLIEAVMNRGSELPR